MQKIVLDFADNPRENGFVILRTTYQRDKKYFLEDLLAVLNSLSQAETTFSIMEFKHRRLNFEFSIEVLRR